MISSWLLPYLPRLLREHIAGRAYLLRVIDDTGWVFAERAVRHVTGFLVGIWLARYVGPEQYGLLNFALSFVFVLTFLSTLGFDGIAVRDIVRDPGRRDETLGTLISMRIVGGVLVVLIAAALVLLVEPGDSRATPLIVVISLTLVFLAFDSIDCWFQANQTSRRTLKARIVVVCSFAIVRILLILAHAPLIAFAWAILAESIVIAVGLVAVYHRSGLRLAGLRPTVARAKTLLGEGWPLLLSTFVATLSQRIDQIMLGEMAGYVQVGIYAAAARVMEVTYIVPAVLATSLFPAMVKSRAADEAQYQQLVEKIYGGLFWLGVALAVPLCLLSSVIVHVLLGSEYAGAAVPLSILSWMPLLVFFNMLRQRWLVAEHALAAALAFEVAVCLLSVLCNLLLIPRYGVAGAAISALASVFGATLAVAPFSRSIRRSLGMLLRGALVPLRLWR